MFQISKDWSKEEKFRELVLYICAQDDPRLGAVKLNKILFYADMQAYRRLGRSISGDEYQHLREGPAPRHLLPVRASLIEDGSAVVEEVQYFNGIQTRLKGRRAPELRAFDDEEIAIVDSVVDQLHLMNAREVTEISHEEVGWRVTEEGETIPYVTAWLSAQPLSQEQVAVGLEIAERRGFLVAAG